MAYSLQRALITRETANPVLAEVELESKSKEISYDTTELQLDRVGQSKAGKVQKGVQSPRGIRGKFHLRVRRSRICSWICQVLDRVFRF